MIKKTIITAIAFSAVTLMIINVNVKGGESPCLVLTLSEIEALAACEVTYNGSSGTCSGSSGTCTMYTIAGDRITCSGHIGGWGNP